MYRVHTTTRHDGHLWPILGVPVVQGLNTYVYLPFISPDMLLMRDASTCMYMYSQQYRCDCE